MNRQQHEEVYRTEVMERPAFNPVLARALHHPVLWDAYPDYGELREFLRTQQPQDLYTAGLFTEEHYRSPNVPAEVPGGVARYPEGWVLAACFDYLELHPGQRASFPHLYGSITSANVARAAIVHLREPRLLALDAPQFDAPFWMGALQDCPEAFRFLSDEMRNNVVLARVGIRQVTNMFMFGGVAVRGNYDLARLAVGRDGRLLHYCSIPLRSDIVIVTRACQQNVEAAAFIGRGIPHRPRVDGRPPPTG